MIADRADPNTIDVRGVQPTLEQLKVGSTLDAQNSLVNTLIATAGLPEGPLPAESPQWRLVWKAGQYEIGRQCDQYLDALFRFNRRQRADRQGLAVTAAATAAIMGLTGAAAEALAITAAAFGLTTALFDAEVNSVLFTIEPSALRNVAQQGLTHYLDSIDETRITSRPDTLIALQGYLVQCSPAAIEANINNAASGAPSVVSPDPKVAAAAAVAAAPSAALLEQVKREIGRTVQTTPPAVTEHPAGQTANEELERLRIRNVATAQLALGMTGDGRLGEGTRDKIEEFQFGMNVRAPSGWRTSAVDGELRGETATLLTTMTPMPPGIFLSPFERAYLGNRTGAASFTQPDPEQLIRILDFLRVPQERRPADGDLNAGMKTMHDEVAKYRTRNNVDIAKGGELDSVLFKRLQADSRAEPG